MFITPNDSVTSGANHSIEELRTYRVMTPKEMEDYKKNGSLPKANEYKPRIGPQSGLMQNTGPSTNVPTLAEMQAMDAEKYQRQLRQEENREREREIQEENMHKSRVLMTEENMRKQRNQSPSTYGSSAPMFYDGGIVGGMGGRDNNTAQVTRGEGIIQAKSMNKIGASTFNHINKTGELPMKEIQLNVDALMKTPPWMKDFQSSVAALAGTSIKAELAPVSVNVKINGAEVLASIQGQMKDLIKREVMTAVGNMYHDNSGKHLVRGM
jgi:hypothetical protein